jgi:hypothetical protein
VKISDNMFIVKAAEPALARSRRAIASSAVLAAACDARSDDSIDEQIEEVPFGSRVDMYAKKRKIDTSREEPQ